MPNQSWDSRNAGTLGSMVTAYCPTSELAPWPPMCVCSHATHVKLRCLRGFSLSHALHKDRVRGGHPRRKHTSPGPTRNVHATRRIRVALTAVEASGLLAYLSTAGPFLPCSHSSNSAWTILADVRGLRKIRAAQRRVGALGLAVVLWLCIGQTQALRTTSPPPPPSRLRLCFLHLA